MTQGLVGKNKIVVVVFIPIFSIKVLNILNYTIFSHNFNSAFSWRHDHLKLVFASWNCETKNVSDPVRQLGFSCSNNDERLATCWRDFASQNPLNEPGTQFAFFKEAPYRFFHLQKFGILRSYFCLLVVFLTFKVILRHFAYQGITMLMFDLMDLTSILETIFLKRWLMKEQRHQ